MASIKEISLPHGTIPTQMFGNVNLQNAVMYVNENFAAVKEGVNDAVTATNEAIAEKADGDHDHDDAYAALGHTHSQSEVIGLSSALDGKADLNHEHSQYLSSLPAHYHDVTGVQGLGEQLQAKAEKTHSHTMAQVENLSTELGVKASTAYVDQQVNAVGSTIKTIADQEIIDCGAAKEGTGGEASDDVPKDVEIAPVNEGVSHKNGRVGTKNRWARADHQHVFQTETDETKLSKLKCDGNGTDGAASFGTETIVPRIDHSHPLNFPDSESRPLGLAQDGLDADDKKNVVGRFGDTNYYADLGHSHSLNVDTSTESAPSDVVKSTQAASNGTAKYYARQDHIHKMPALDSDDIALGTVTGSGVPSGTVSYAINNHEGRIKDLEDEGPGGGTVKSVDGEGPDDNGNVQIDAIKQGNIGNYAVTSVNGSSTGSITLAIPSLAGNGSATTASKSDHYHGNIKNDGSLNVNYAENSLVMINSSGQLTSAAGTVSDNPKVTQDNVYKALTCFNLESTGTQTIKGGQVSLGADNKSKLVITNANGNLSATSGANQILTSNSNSVVSLTSAGDGLQIDNGTLKVKCATGGGITADANGIAMGGFSGTDKWVKTDGSGKITTTNDTPITASTTMSGVVYNNAGTISYKGIGDESGQVASGDHAHAYGSASLTGFGTAAEKDVGVTANDVAAGSHVHGNITADGKLNGCSSANCFLVTTTNAVITHSNLAPKVSDVKDLVTQWINADKKLGAVSSVCGKTGTVTLDNSDVGAAATNHTHTVSDISNFSSSVQSLINSALTSYATQSWVTSQLSDKASQSSVDTLTDSLESLTAIVQQISSDYVTSAELASYATQEWVQSQGYVTDEELGEYLTTDDISQASINALASGVLSSTLKVVGEVTWNGSDLQYKYKEVTITKGIITNVPGSYSTKTIDTPTVITWS